MTKPQQGASRVVEIGRASRETRAPMGPFVEFVLGMSLVQLAHD